MNIIPELNLNKHPNAIINNSIVYAENIMLSDDGGVLQNEPVCAINEDIYSVLSDEYKNGVNVIYALSCNTEILFFIRPDNQRNILEILRYNEKLKESKIIVDNFEYNGGKLLGTFTYNKDNLIIAVSEYFEDNSKSIPLKVLNLGKFEDDIAVINNDLHTIQPKVTIPTVYSYYESGLSYKGWYYIFIRYKLDDDNYTQWYNTNESIFVDNYDEINILDYYLSDKIKENETVIGDGKTRQASVLLSSNGDISNITFKCELSNLDIRYKEYQLGFICISKTYTKAFKTLDKKISDPKFIFNSKVTEEYNASDLIKSYYNYYNVKTLDNINNRLYIGNYNVNNKENNINPKNITITIGETIKENVPQVESVENTLFAASYKDYFINVPLSYINDIPVISSVSFIARNDALFDDYENITKVSYNITDTIKIGFGANILGTNIYYEGPANNLFYDPLNKEYLTINSNNEIESIYKEDNDRDEIHVLLTVNNNKIKNGFIINDYFNWELKKELFAKSINESIDILSSASIAPENYYNLFIHFIDEYGEITNGFPINTFNLQFNSDNKYVSYDENSSLIFINDIDKDKLLLNVTLSNIPEKYIGYFVSYEQFESSIKYKGFCKKDDKNNQKVYFYSDELIFADSVSFDFDKIRIYNSNNNIVEIEENIVSLNKEYNLNGSVGKVNSEEITILNKTLKAPDALNNILSSACLELNIKDASDILKTDDYCVAYLYKSTTDDLYKKENKQLIPASPIIYSKDITAEVNIKTGFISTHHAIIFNKVYFDVTKNVYRYQTGAIANTPFYVHKFKGHSTIPIESLQLKNKPTIIYYPVKVKDDDTTTSFKVGYEIEAKDTIDLFNQSQLNIYDLYPKSLTWKNKFTNYNNIFNKTIRRSNILQDESNVNNWRNFEIEQYRNIHENKGDIVKLIGIGKYFIVHTEHSMFLFNATDTIKSNEGGIQLASVDILDLNYQEVITSKLGYCGIKKEHHGIVGSFGYIFYDDDNKTLYKYDNNSITEIDANIKYLLNNTDIKDISFGDDKERKRLFIAFKTENNDTKVLSYNYKINKFISTHNDNTFKPDPNSIFTFNIDTIDFFSTKNKCYIKSSQTKTYNKPILDENGEVIRNEKVSITSGLLFEFVKDIYSKSSISIIHNNNYEVMKYLDNIIYKINQINNANDNQFLPVEGKNIHYAGDSLEIFSELCYTGKIDIDTSKNLNNPDNYMTPYWRFGNWHFNAIRNKLTNSSLTSDEKSRIFGNWFVVRFEFNTDIKVEIESLECKTSIAEY